MGYEISEEYLAKSRELGVRGSGATYVRRLPPWAHPTVVYIARPFKDDEYEVAWERSVMKAMRPGAVLISAYAAVKPGLWPCYYWAPFRGVWTAPLRPSYSAMIARPFHWFDPLSRSRPAVVDKASPDASRLILLRLR